MIKMTIKFLTKKEKIAVKNTKSLNSFFKTEKGEPFCFGEFGTYHTKKSCSDCKFKKECYKKYEEKD